MLAVTKWIFCIVIFGLLFSTTDIQCKRGGTSGASSRGRGGVFSSIKNALSGNRGMQRHGGFAGTGLGTKTNTGWRPPPSRGIFGGQRYGSGGMMGGRSPWARTAGRSNYASARNKAMLSGALGSLAGAYVGYKVGQAMHRPWHMYNGRQYWYGARHYHPTVQGRQTCVFELDDSTPNWNVRYENDNTKVREVVFECSAYEYCCEMSCCPATSRRNGAYSSYGHGWRWWHTFLTLFVLGAILVICAGAAGKMTRQRYGEQNVVLSSYDEVSSKPLSQPGYMASGTAYRNQPNQYFPTARPVYR